MDAWHWATVAVLSVALIGEAIGAYGKQKVALREWLNSESGLDKRHNMTGWRFAWMRLWYVIHLDEQYGRSLLAEG